MCVSRCGAASLNTSLHESCVYQRSLIFSRGQNDKSFSAGCCPLEFSAACTGHTLCRAALRVLGLRRHIAWQLLLSSSPTTYWFNANAKAPTKGDPSSFIPLWYSGMRHMAVEFHPLVLDVEKTPLDDITHLEMRVALQWRRDCHIYFAIRVVDPQLALST